MDMRGAGRDVDFIDRWVQAMCLAPSARPEDLAAAMGIDAAGASRIGGQMTFPPPPGTETFEFIIGLDSADVSFAEFTPSGPLRLADLTARFGEGREAPPSPHEPGPTVILDEACPPGARRACVVLVRLAGGWPRSEAVTAVTLYLRPGRDNAPDGLSGPAAGRFRCA